MGMGLPVLHGVAGESAAIVERERAGLVFTPEDVDELVNALLRLQGDDALRASLRDASLAAARRYDRDVLAMRMLDALRALVTPSTLRARDPAS
jgi:glycosyltransferase involved in cell wall biosynthesis